MGRWGAGGAGGAGEEFLTPHLTLHTSLNFLLFVTFSYCQAGINSLKSI
ncbi:MAG: hypothetical protein KME17_29090 [Cyanosarcina radialis HA8281-LM2]|nr:hypothetical protein [Cyanosarcina radialis HA8281-LM2]